MSKPKTQAQLDKATDTRLRKTYNISLKDYEYLLKLGNGGCWICGRPEGDRRLHVDHDHGWKKAVYTCLKIGAKWEATGVYNGNVYQSSESKKSLAIKGLKREMLRASVRGLLCYQHNAGLQKFSDNHVQLINAANYLTSYIKESPLTGRGVGDAS